MKYRLNQENIKSMSRGDLVQNVQFGYILVVLENDGKEIKHKGLTSGIEQTSSVESFLREYDRYIYFGTLHKEFKVI